MTKIADKMHTQKGYTLIELAIVSTILAIILSSGMAAYLSWFRKQQYEQTVQNTEIMAAAISSFKGQNNRYPCPAPLVPRTDPAYGYEGNCGAGTAVSAPGCAGGTCVVAGQRTLSNLDLMLDNTDADDNGVIDVDPDQVPSIRVGMVPFRSLNVPEDFSLDRYGNVLTYAVTEIQARNFPHNPAAGGIAIIDEDGNTMVQPAGSADFIVLSHGVDLRGGRAIGGALSALCDTTALDGENCDDDAIFRQLRMSTSTGAENFDDIVRYQVPSGAPMWARSPSDPNSIYYTRNGGAIGSDFSYNFETRDNRIALGEDTRLWIAGNLRVDGNIRSSGYCDQNGENCFPTRVIAGAGINCDAGNRLMYGIEQSASRCANEVLNLQCPGDQIVQSIPNGGTEVIGCSDPPIIPYPADACPTCAAVKCTPPWGGAQVVEGGTIQAYNNTDCTPITRTCQADTTFSGDGSYNQESRPAACDDVPPSVCNLPWGGTINDGANILAYNDTECEGQPRTCSGTTLNGDPEYDNENKPAACNAPCVPRYRWITDGINGNLSHAAACAAVGATSIPAHYRGICASGERRPVSGHDYQKIQYKRGTWGGGGRGGDVAPWQNNAYRCYANGGKWDKDNTDVVQAYYCDFGAAFPESCSSDDPPVAPPVCTPGPVQTVDAGFNITDWATESRQAGMPGGRHGMTGICGTSLATKCSAGSARNIRQESDHIRWICDGSNSDSECRWNTCP